MEKVIVVQEQKDGKEAKIEEKCPKCGKNYIDSLYCWPSLGSEEPARCVEDKIYLHKWVMGNDLTIPRVIH